MVFVMKVILEREENRQFVLEIEAEQEETEKAINSACRRLAKKAKIPGFRPGKVPPQIMERYLGRETLLGEAAEDFVPGAYAQAVKVRELKPVAPPRIEITRKEPLTFRATIPLEPLVELGDYRQLSFPLSLQPVSEEQVQLTLERMASEAAPWEPGNGPAKTGDLVTLDVEGKAGEQVVASQKGVQYQMRPESQAPLPGFAEQLVGLEPGGEKSFPLIFPPDYPNVELRGQECQFRVKLAEIRVRNPQPLSDELAKSLGWENLAALREEIARRLRSQAEIEAKRKVEEAVLQAVRDSSKVELPPLLVERDVDHMIKDRNLQGGDKVQEELRPLAIQRLTRALLLNKVAEAEKIAVADQELEAELARMSRGQRGGEIHRFFQSPSAQQALRETLLHRKALDCLVALVTQEKAPEQGVRNEEQGTKSQEQGTGNQEQGA